MDFQPLTYVCLTPHPPIIVPAVGGREVEKVRSTVGAMQEAARELVARQPEVIICISPHSVVLRDAVAVLTVSRFSGSLREFGAPQVKFDLEAEKGLAEGIVRVGQEYSLPVVALDEARAARYLAPGYLDHGVMVPLYYFQEAGWQGRLVVMAFGLLSPRELYRVGQAIREAGQASGKKVALVASGDMSHRLIPQAPAGYDPQGAVFDARVKEAISRHDVASILETPEDLAEAAGECGLRSLIIALGSLDGVEVEPRVLSYEGSFGVGYLVANWLPRAGTGFSFALDSLPVRLARESLETYVRTGHRMAPPSDLPPELKVAAGAFVSLHKHGQLRGCIGTIAPTCPTVAEEIIQNALSAGLQDPRFPPVQPDELAELEYSVDILQPPEPVASLEELDPRRYGVIVRSGRRSGLLLPDLEGVATPEEQVSIALQKAGIRPGEPYQMERFTVVRYH